MALFDRLRRCTRSSATKATADTRAGRLDGEFCRGPPRALVEPCMTPSSHMALDDRPFAMNFQSARRLGLAWRDAQAITE